MVQDPQSMWWPSIGHRSSLYLKNLYYLTWEREKFISLSNWFCDADKTFAMSKLRCCNYHMKEGFTNLSLHSLIQFAYSLSLSSFYFFFLYVSSPLSSLSLSLHGHKDFIDGNCVACKPIILSPFVYIYWNELLFIVILVWYLQWSMWAYVMTNWFTIGS